MDNWPIFVQIRRSHDVDIWQRYQSGECGSSPISNEGLDEVKIT